MRRLLGVSIVLLAILACSPNPSVESYSVVVNYDQSLEEMIAAGNYDYVDPNISENFPAEAGVSGQVTVELEFVYFNRYMASDEVLAELDNKGLRPATLPELLAFGAQYPDPQRQYVIVALGSVWQNWYSDRYVPDLCSWRGGRNLCLRRFEYDWPESFRFLCHRTTPK